MSAERWRSSRVCAGLHSAPVSRSVDNEIGATRVVAVIQLSPCRGVSHASRTLSVGGIRGGGLLWSFFENNFEKVQEFADLRLGDDERRQEPKSEVVCAVHQQTALHRFINKRRAFEIGRASCRERECI